MTLALPHPVQQHPVEPAPVAVTRRWQRSRVLSAVGALAYLTTLATLLAWSVLPLLLGWSAYLVQSGSMMPAIEPGDVLVSAPVDGVASLRRGDIVVVDDPAQPGRLLSHRVARVRDDGFVITRGDANDHVDSTPVPSHAVQGQGRMLVPYVGMPQQWLVSGDYALLAGWLALTCLAVGAVATDPSRRYPVAPRHRGSRPNTRGRRRRAAPWWSSRARPGLRAVAAGLVVTALVVAARGHGVSASFGGVTDNFGNAFASHPDFVAPDAGAVTVYKTKGYLTGVIRPSGPYRVYADVTDTGNPPSGTASVAADMTALTAGATSAPLSSGSTSVAGTTYNHGSSQLTADSGVSNGSQSYSLAMTDAAGNVRTRGYSVTVDGAAPTAVNVDATNTSGGVVGKPEPGDTFTLTFSERLDPYSVIDGWTGAPRSVHLVIQATATSNAITVWPDGTSGALPLGETVTDVYRWTLDKVSFTGSTMTQSGNTISVVLGTPNASVQVVDATHSTLTYTPSSTPYDAAGNPLSTTAVAESGTADLDF